MSRFQIGCPRINLEWLHYFFVSHRDKIALYFLFSLLPLENSTIFLNCTLTVSFLPIALPGTFFLGQERPSEYVAMPTVHKKKDEFKTQVIL